MAEQKDNIEETKYDDNDDENGISFRFSLSDVTGYNPIQGIEPIDIRFNENTTPEGMLRKLQNIMQITEHDGKFEWQQRFSRNNKLPNSYSINVGNEDKINFAHNIFTISQNTRFIQYWNDFLDEAKIYDEEKKAADTEGYIKYEGNLSVMLKDSTLTIGDAEIEFMRTLRIPDDNKTYPLPPSLGKFELVKVQDYYTSDGLPDKWKKRKGIILPMWQKEAMFIRFTTKKNPMKYEQPQCAIKIGIGKINAVTGKAWKSKYISVNSDNQNYCALPKQLWLDGINCGDGYIRQFVAMPLGKGYTVEHQIKKMEKEKENKQQNESETLKSEVEKTLTDIQSEMKIDIDEEDIFEDVGGIQFEVYPKFDDEVHISVKKKYPQNLFTSFGYKKELLQLTPNEHKLQNGDIVFLFSLSLPESFHRDITASEMQFSKYSENETYRLSYSANSSIFYEKWIRFAVNNSVKNNKYIIIFDGWEYDVIFIENTIVEAIIEKNLQYQNSGNQSPQFMKTEPKQYDINRMWKYDEKMNEIPLKSEVSFEDQGIRYGDILRYKSYEDNGGMCIYIKTGWGKQELLTMDIELNDTVQHIKSQIKDTQQWLGPYPLRLIFNGQELQDEKSLSDYNIERGSCLKCSLILRGGCFVKGSKVLMNGNKLMNIEDVKQFSEVMTYNAISKSFESHFVEKTIQVFSNELCILKMEGNNEPIICTSSHPIYITNKDEWCCVQPIDNERPKLCVGDYVMNEKGESVAIINIEQKSYDYNVPVYTLYINQVHNFFVNGILVHNGSPFTLSIKIPTGQIFTITAEGEYTIKMVKTMIALRTNNNIAISDQTLWYDGKQLLDEKKLMDYDIWGGEKFVYLMIKWPHAITLRISPPIAYGQTFEIQVMKHSTIQNIKLHIENIKNIHAENQQLLFSGIELEDIATVMMLGFTNNTTLQLLVTGDENEMGLAAGGKIKQKIYEDDEVNLNQYNTNRVTRVFINIANGNMWKAITNKTLPKSPLNPLIYKTYGYPWFGLYDDELGDVDKSENLFNIKSVKEIEYDPNKPWNCPVCTFENVGNILKCVMCYQGDKPTLKNEQEKESIVIGKQNMKTIKHPHAVDDGDW